MTPNRESAPSPDEIPYYRDFAAQYDDISRGVPGDVEFYVDLARRVGGTMVELGVGTGRIAIPVARSGVRVLGIDRDPAMLAVAAEKARRDGVLDLLTLVEGDMRTFEVGERVSLVAIPFRTFQHNLTVEDQRATLSACRAALRRGGLLALNVFNPYLALMERWTKRSSRHWEPLGERALSGEDEEAQLQHRPELPERLITTRLRVRDGAGGWWNTSFRLRYINRSEMELLLMEAGFDVVSLAGDFGGGLFEKRSPEMIWVAAAR